MSDLEEWVETFVRKTCPACGRPVAGSRNKHGERATCGASECINKCRGRQQRKPVSEKKLREIRDPRSCRCGAKLSFLVDMYGQALEMCDRCGHRAYFGQHPIKDAA